MFVYIISINVLIINVFNYNDILIYDNVYLY